MFLYGGKDIKEKKLPVYIKTESEICITYSILHIVTVILIKNLFNERQVKLVGIILFNEKFIRAGIYVSYRIRNTSFKKMSQKIQPLKKIQNSSKNLHLNTKLSYSLR